MKQLFNLLSAPAKYCIWVCLLAGPCISMAAAPERTSWIFTVDLLSLFLIALLIFIIFVLLFLLYSMHSFFSEKKKTEETMLSGVMRSLTDSVPIEKEEAILTDHVYDGIRELDNNLPPWWKYLFYATIVFSCVYIYFYHFSEYGKLQIPEYEQELVEAETAKQEYMKHAANSIDESNAKMMDAAGIENGKNLFAENCSACHGKLGEGGVGPNLTDPYWLHGGGIQNIFKTIKYGVPQKGMISWKSQLSPLNIQELSSYIISIHASNPPNAKAPQGDLYEETK